ncbi:MAG: serine/threonine-protein phosphatase [Polyangiaceae bacterium]|nr:serine/threonine-protein phosphatase [Polyangiaceae bacterium]
MPYRKGHHPVQIHLAALTNTGAVRESNEDAFFVASANHPPVFGPPTQTVQLVSRAWLFGVFDGLGTARDRTTASLTAAEMLPSQIGSYWPQAGCEHLARQLEKAILAAGQKVFAMSTLKLEHRGMGTTATVAALVDQHLKIAHVGDCRAYLFRSGTLQQITRDHTLVEHLIDNGKLTREEAKSFEHQSVVMQALGPTENVKVDNFSVDLTLDDMVIVTTDGIHGMVDNAQIAAIATGHTDPLACVNALVDAAEKAGGHDNQTVIVAKMVPFQ